MKLNVTREENPRRYVCNKKNNKLFSNKTTKLAQEFLEVHNVHVQKKYIKPRVTPA